MAIVDTTQVRIFVGTHFFAIVPLEVRSRNAIYDVLATRVATEWAYDPSQGRNVRVQGKVWGGRLNDNSVFRMPISMLPEMLRKLKQATVSEDFIKIVRLPTYEPLTAEIKLNPAFTLYEKQEEALKFALDSKAQGYPSCLLQMPTGTGKTVTLSAVAASLGLRLGIFVSPAYVEKWKQDLQKYLMMTEDQFFEVRGRKSIRKLFEESEAGTFDKDATIFSLATLTEFFKEYEENPENAVDIYGGSPFDIWKAAGIGFLGGDETHERFHQVYWLNTFIHGPFHLGLSATMLHNDPFIEDRQKEIYPQSIRFTKIKMKKYIHFVEFSYTFKDIERSKIKTNFPGRSTYSQHAYEISIVKNKEAFHNFLEMIQFLVDEYYMKDRKEGEKLAIYCSRIEMINKVLNFLKATYPKLDIRRYAENDPYEDCINADIRVTNRGKAGTAVDIPGLTRVIAIDNVESAQAVLQLVGRLREVKDRDVVFIQTYCTSVKKHVAYKESRRELVEDRVAGFTEHRYNRHL